jgi:hypothetical protein
MDLQVSLVDAPVQMEDKDLQVSLELMVLEVLTLLQVSLDLQVPVDMLEY